jgi:hypothetical protein
MMYALQKLETTQHFRGRWRPKLGYRDTAPHGHSAAKDRTRTPPNAPPLSAVVAGTLALESSVDFSAELSPSS